MAETDTIRIGCGSGHSRDRASAAVTVAETEEMEYLCCDRLAERTLAAATTSKEAGESEGYNPLLDRWFRKVLPPAVENDVTIIGNFGAANPAAAGERIAELANELGYEGLTIATITGDDVRDALPNYELVNMETGDPLRLDDLPGEVVSASAYIGADKIVEALETGADVIVGGRIGDLSLFLAPMIHEFDWSQDDIQRMAAGSTVAHLIECGIHSTGGNLAKPGYVEVPGKHNLGLPYADVEPSGEAVISKPEETGGIVTELSLAAQLLYEIHDPENYLTPDVTVDVSDVTLEQVGEDKVRVEGARGKPRPNDLKVLVGVDAGYIAEVEMGWAGHDSLAKANMAIEDSVEPTLEHLNSELELIETRIDRIGVDGIFGEAAPEPDYEPNEVRVRVAAKTTDQASADRICDALVQQLFFPAVGSGGLQRDTRPYLEVFPTLLPREAVDLSVSYTEVGA